MIINTRSKLLLTYCTNIHPGNGWQQVFINLKNYAPKLKKIHSPKHPFGIGLRLSNKESMEILKNNQVEKFKKYLNQNKLFVFTLNGFPYGIFHKNPIKEKVYAPDWQNTKRVTYTLRLVKILSELLPNNIDGSISTLPLTYKKWVEKNKKQSLVVMTENIIKVVEKLIYINQQKGQMIHLDFEPEPDCLLENSEDVIDFYRQWLFGYGVRLLSKSQKVSRDQAKKLILDHIRICLDLCHMAVAFENAGEIIKKYRRFGIKIGKIQISSALCANLGGDKLKNKQILESLKMFTDPVYLHQVTQKGKYLTKYADLPQALAEVNPEEKLQLRIHFHVPVFLSRLGKFISTQNEIIKTLSLIKKLRLSPHLEIETYTWDVLPKAYKINLLDSISREYSWVLKYLD